MVVPEFRLTAQEAQQLGLVSRVVAPEELLKEAQQIASKIASLSAPAVAKAKDCVNRAYEMSLSEGLRYELYDPAPFASPPLTRAGSVHAQYGRLGESGNIFLLLAL